MGGTGSARFLDVSLGEAPFPPRVSMSSLSLESWCEVGGVFEGVSTDSLKFTWAHLTRPFYALRAGTPPKRPYGCFLDGLRLSSTPLDTLRHTVLANSPSHLRKSSSGLARLPRRDPL
jgi:hypothetical protein